MQGRSNFGTIHVGISGSVVRDMGVFASLFWQRVLNELWQCSSALYCAELLYKTTTVGRLLESYLTQQLPGSFSNEKHISHYLS